MYILVCTYVHSGIFCTRSTISIIERGIDPPPETMHHKNSNMLTRLNERKDFIHTPTLMLQKRNSERTLMYVHASAELNLPTYNLYY